MTMVKRLMLAATAAGIAAMMAAAPARAVPLLQLYIEGATYNVATETWELLRPIDQPLRLWTIGNVAGPGGTGTLSAVRLRSEEHTPELQSLMRNSYAVFCLNKHNTRTP